MKKKIIITLIGIVLIIGIVTGIIFVTRKKDNVVPFENKNIEGMYYDERITDIESAKKSIDSVKDEIGLTSLTELDDGIENNSSTIYNTYSFNQYYNGVRYSGHGLIAYTDKDGNAKGIINSFEKIEDNFDIKPKNSAKDLEDIVLKEIGNNSEIEDSELVIYDLDEDNKILAYVYNVTDGVFNYIVMVSDNSKEVLMNNCEFNTLTSSDIEKYKIDDEVRSMLEEPADGSYMIMDKKRKIFEMTYNEKKNELNYYTWNTVSDIDSKKDYSLREESMNTIAKIYDYYLKFEYNSYDNKGSNINFCTGVESIKTNEGYEKFSGNAGMTGNTVLFGSKNYYNSDVEAIGHEFTHAVINTQKPFKEIPKDSYEAFALREAYSDIMGMCMEAYYSNPKAERIDGIIDPNHFNRDLTKDKYFYKNGKGLVGEEHDDSRIITRAAYLMSEYMTLEEFEKLWFDSIFLLPYESNFNFWGCEYAVLKSAKDMGLSNEKQEKILEAFKHVGLEDMSIGKLRESGTGGPLKDKVQSFEMEEKATKEKSTEEILYPHYDSNSKLYGYIDKSGKYVIEPTYLSASEFDSQTKLATVNLGSNSQVGVINMKGEFVIEAKYNAIGTKISNGYIILAKKDVRETDYAIADKEGKIVYDFTHDDIRNVSSNSLFFLAGGEPGYYNMQGERVIPADRGEEFNENGYASAMKTLTAGEYEGIVKEDGTWVVEPFAKQLTSVNKNGYALYSEDYNSWGILNINTGEKGEVKFTNPLATGFSNAGVTFAKQTSDGLYGIINEQGEWVVEPKYKKVNSFNDFGYSLVQINDKWFVIDSNGNSVTDENIDKLEKSYSDTGIWRLVVDGKYGIFGPNGKYIVEPF